MRIVATIAVLLFLPPLLSKVRYNRYYSLHRHEIVENTFAAVFISAAIWWPYLRTLL